MTEKGPVLTIGEVGFSCAVTATGLSIDPNRFNTHQCHHPRILFIPPDRYDRFFSYNENTAETYRKLGHFVFESDIFDHPHSNGLPEGTRMGLLYVENVINQIDRTEDELSYMFQWMNRIITEQGIVVIIDTFGSQYDSHLYKHIRELALTSGFFPVFDSFSCESDSFADLHELMTTLVSKLGLADPAFENGLQSLLKEDDCGSWMILQRMNAETTRAFQFPTPVEQNSTS